MDQRRRDRSPDGSRRKSRPARLAVALLVVLGISVTWLFVGDHPVYASNGSSGAAVAQGTTSSYGGAIALRLVPGARLVESADGTLRVSQGGTALSESSSRPGVRLKATELIDGLNVQVLEPTLIGTDLEASVRALRLMPGVLWAEIAQPIYASLVPNDPYYVAGPYTATGQWGLPRVGFPAAWDITTGSADVTVAVLDTGLNNNISDFSGRIVSPYNALADESGWPACADADGHGSAVAAVAVARGNDGQGMAGAAWNVKLMPVKISEDGSSTDLILAEGIEYAVDNGADVINVSFATPPGSSVSYALTVAVSYALTRGVVIVAAAGNDNANAVSYPAALPGVIAVGATNSSDARWVGSGSRNGSNTGTDLDLVAPGAQITSYYPGSPSAFASWVGTSVAAPLVTGAVALIRSVNPDLTPGQIADIINYSADDMGASGRDDEFGWGLLDAAEAVANAASGSSTTTSSTTTTTTEAPTTTTTTATSTTTTTTAGEPPVFPDVTAESTPYWDEIAYLAGLGIVSGSGDGLFHPQDALKRQQFAKMIVIALGYPVAETDMSPFSDVQDVAGDLYPYHYVAVVYGRGITQGTKPGHFSPYGTLTRAQLITMVTRAAELPEPPVGYSPPFSNFSTTHYSYARRAAYAGLLDGLVGMGPAYAFFAPATRGEVCALLYALLQ